MAPFLVDRGGCIAGSIWAVGGNLHVLAIYIAVISLARNEVGRNTRLMSRTGRTSSAVVGLIKRVLVVSNWRRSFL